MRTPRQVRQNSQTTQPNALTSGHTWHRSYWPRFLKLMKLETFRIGPFSVLKLSQFIQLLMNLFDELNFNRTFAKQQQSQGQQG